MQVKAALAEIRSRPFTWPTMPTSSKALAAAERIPAPALEIETGTQDIDDIDETAARLAEALTSGPEPEQRDVNRAAYCIWAGRRPLAREPTVLGKLLALISASRRRSAFRRLASAYLIAFDPAEVGRQSSALSQVARILSEMADRANGPLSDASRHLHLFDPTKAPRTIATLALQRGSTPATVLHDFQIRNLGAETGLVEAAFLAGLEGLSANHTLDPSMRLATFKAWGTRSDGSIVFEHRRGAYVDALLATLPSDVGPTTMDSYLKFLVGTFGDPRLRPARWTPMASKPTVLKWLTALSLRQFLDVVDQGAYDFQWKYRRVFWEAVHRNLLVEEAWVIFDEAGDRTAKRLFDVRAPYARWTTGGTKQIARGHAVLLLKIGRGVVAEWSHNGRCNVWHDRDDPTAPKLGNPTYDSDEVRIRQPSTPRFRRQEIQHGGSSGYLWQAKVAEEIFRLTTKRVMESEYKVRDGD